ncbi:hypothetical protein I9X26_32350 [Pseudomonas aeruginosa]|nr:hypothetical protein [Pseudomonas aeruginosa]QPZ59519.1 hypothetical protein I9X26_32350 [Pseudomonas aeruginosa]
MFQQRLVQRRFQDAFITQIVQRLRLFVGEQPRQVEVGQVAGVGFAFRAMRQDMPGDRLEQAGAVLQFGKLGIRIFWLIGSYHDDGTNHQLSGLPG